MKPSLKQLSLLESIYSGCRGKKAIKRPLSATSIERILIHLIINGPITSQEAVASELKVSQLASVVHRLHHHYHITLDRRDVIRDGYGGKPTLYKQYSLKTNDLEYGQLLVNSLRERRGVEYIDWNTLVFCQISDLLEAREL